MNNFATPLTENGCLRGRRCAYLVKESTTTNMQLAALDNGKPSTKSKDKMEQEGVEAYQAT